MKMRDVVDLPHATREYVAFITGKSPEELSYLNPEDEVALVKEINGSAPSWSRELKGSFRGRGNINIANRRIKTLDKADAFLDGLVSHGARQF